MGSSPTLCSKYLLGVMAARRSPKPLVKVRVFEGMPTIRSLTQLDRVSVFETEGREFESLRAGHYNDIHGVAANEFSCGVVMYSINSGIVSTTACPRTLSPADSDTTFLNSTIGNFSAL